MMLFVVLFAVFGLAVGQDIDITTCDTFQGELSACRTQHPLTVSVTVTAKQFMEFYKLPTTTSCDAKFADLLACVMVAYKKCGSEQQKQFVGDSASYKGAVKKICDNKADYNEACITAAFDTCVTTNAGAKPGSDSNDKTLNNYQCSRIEAFLKCADTTEALTTCDKPKTKTVLKEILSSAKPEVCNSTDAATSVVLTASLLVVSLMTSMFF